MCHPSEYNATALVMGHAEARPSWLYEIPVDIFSGNLW